MIAALAVSEFDEYFRAIHGYDPFPWQTRLLERIAADDRWPSLLDLPTGTGKTAALDVALFHLALEAGKGVERRAAIRIVMVVDRRTVVDQAYLRGRHIQKQLVEGSGVLARVRERLAALADSPELPLQVALLRGGMARDDAWARSPSQPLVAASTVDQVGSRLLFRGYGVTDSMQPIHAGLLGNDTLLLLDEVHLSQPFCETLEALESRYRGWAERPLPWRSQVVRMSATPGAAPGDRFSLERSDRAHPILRERLRAKRPVRVPDAVASSGGEDKRRNALIDKVADAAKTYVDAGKSAVAVVVNRVRTARGVFDVLREAIGDRADIVLVTGRMRPIDRDRLERAIRPRVAAGRTETPGDRSIVVVATQCIEAGADFDFDAMVTECASLDALRQRFGRLNRLGTRSCEGVIVVRADAVSDDADPIYGTALAATWRYLRSLGDEQIVDFGLESFPMPDAETLGRLVTPPDWAPTLLPRHLDGWCQTAPVPEPDNEVGLWLHGPARGTPDVLLVWRNDISQEELDSASDDDLENLIDRLEVLPPSVAEALAVPFHEACAWLSGRVSPDDSGDALGERERDKDAHPLASRGRRALAWHGEKSRFVVGGGRGRERILPGETLIVPAEYGGIPATHSNWDPSDQSPVSDLAEEAHLRTRGRAVLRLEPSAGAPDEVPLPLGVDQETHAEAAARVAEFVKSLPNSLPSSSLEVARRLAREFESRRHPRVVQLVRKLSGGEVRRFAVIGWRRYKTTDPGAPADLTTEEDIGSFTGSEVGLPRHLKGVGKRAREYALRCGLPSEIVEDLALAGWWHDAGKADERFQRMLRRGDPFAVIVADGLLAKSAMPAGDRIARRRARERAGLPEGFRHELVSVALMAAGESSLRERAHDWELVLHLVASHHGSCRPFAPPTEDPSPVEVAFDLDVAKPRASSDHQLGRLDSGVSRRFWRLVRRYGWHGLAWLEAILRLADHRQSEAEQDEELEQFEKSKEAVT